MLQASNALKFLAAPGSHARGFRDWRRDLEWRPSRHAHSPVFGRPYAIWL